MTKPKVEVRIDIHEGLWSKGQYQASISVTATGETTWSGATEPCATPVAAIKAVTKSIERALAPSKRGRKPNGYRSLNMLEGWLSN